MTPAAASAPVACPDCLRDDVMPSKPQGRVERFLFSAFLVYRFRCRACLNRFALRKVGLKYVPLLGFSNKALWSMSLAVIAVSAILLSTMLVKARLATASFRKESVAPAAQPARSQEPEGFKFSTVDDAAPQTKATSQFMDNFQSAQPKQTPASTPDAKK